MQRKERERGRSMHIPSCCCKRKSLFIYFWSKLGWLLGNSVSGKNVSVVMFMEMDVFNLPLWNAWQTIRGPVPTSCSISYLAGLFFQVGRLPDGSRGLRFVCFQWHLVHYLPGAGRWCDLLFSPPSQPESMTWRQNNKVLAKLFGARKLSESHSKNKRIQAWRVLLPRLCWTRVMPSDLPAWGEENFINRWRMNPLSKKNPSWHWGMCVGPLSRNSKVLGGCHTESHQGSSAVASASLYSVNAYAQPRPSWESIYGQIASMQDRIQTCLAAFQKPAEAWLWSHVYRRNSIDFTAGPKSHDPSPLCKTVLETDLPLFPCQTLGTTSEM